MQKKKVLKVRYKRMIINIILLSFFAIFLYSTYMGVRIIYYSNSSKKVQKELIDEVVVVEEKTKEETVDFKRLKEINHDVVGWIQIPDTHINHPILQTSNNAFYLNHNIYKKYNINGSIYMNYQNKSDFSDPNTVIFGHYTHSTEMFSDLKKVYEENWKDVPIYIYTEVGKKTYILYGMYLTDPNDEEPLNIRKSLFIKEDFNIDNKEETDRKTLTLSTCYANGSQRLILHAYLKTEESKNENGKK